MVLNKTFKPGQKLSKYMPLADVIFDIDNKSITHRPDLWGHFGFAREISALYSKPLKKIPGKEPENFKSIFKSKIKVPEIEIEGGAALNYCGLVIEFGTRRNDPHDQVKDALRLDRWLKFGQTDTAIDRASLQANVLKDYCPNTDEWKQSVLSYSNEFVEQAIMM